MITATNKFNIYNAYKKNYIPYIVVPVLSEIVCRIIIIIIAKIDDNHRYIYIYISLAKISFRHAYQKRAEKYERDKIHVGHIRTTIVICFFGTCLAHFTMITWQHDRRPRFARGASIKLERIITYIITSDFLAFFYSILNRKFFFFFFIRLIVNIVNIKEDAGRDILCQIKSNISNIFNICIFFNLTSTSAKQTN